MPRPTTSPKQTIIRLEALLGLSRFSFQERIPPGFGGDHRSPASQATVGEADIWPRRDACQSVYGLLSWRNLLDFAITPTADGKGWE